MLQYLNYKSYWSIALLLLQKMIDLFTYLYVSQSVYIRMINAEIPTV